MTDIAHRMDRMYRRQRHIYDLTRKWFLFGRDTLIEGLSLPAGGTVCEVGCGTARNLMRIARRYPAARLYGLDASAEMLKTAQDRAIDAGLSHRLTLRQGLAERLDPAETFHVARGFDAVVLSYVLSMVPDWPSALGAALRAVKPGGELALVDFGDTDRLPGPVAKALNAWLKRFDVTPRPQIVERLRALEANGVGRLTVPPVLGNYAVVARLRKAI